MLVASRQQLWAWIAVVATAAAAYSWLAWVSAPAAGGRILNSPDETANHVFALGFAQTGSLSLSEPLNVEFNGVVHPRSVVVSGDRLVPGGFLGVPIMYGILGRVLGSLVVVYLTPIVGALTLGALWWLHRQVFGQSAAWAATLLLAAFPAWWYYAARSMFPNLVFVCLLVWAAALWWRWLMQAKARLGYGLAAAALTALALWVRPSEGVWVIAALVVVLVARRKIQSWQSWTLVVSTGLGMMLPLVWVMAQTYGSPLAIVYQPPTVTQVDASTPGLSIQAVLLPFGFHPRRAFHHLVDYSLGLFWWLCWPAFVGWVMTLGRWQLLPSVQRWYWGVSTAIAGYLVVYYGSWQLNDHLDPNAVTLGTSYVRYWLPLYVLMLPYAVVAGQGVVNQLSRRVRPIAAGLLVAAAMLLSAQLTLWAGDESLTAVAARIREYYAQRSAVLARVEPNAVILTERHDKVFFPSLSVVSQAQTPGQLSAISRLAAQRPVYYYTWLLPHDVAKVAERLSDFGLTLGSAERIGSGEALYPVSIAKQP